MWCSGLRRQSGYPDVGCLSPAGGKKLAVSQTFSQQIIKMFEPLATHFTPPVYERTLGAFILQPSGLYAP